MKITFKTRENGPERLLAEAEIEVGDADFTGLKLVGFSLWQGADGAIYVTVPSRASGTSENRKYFDYLRGDIADVKRFKRAVVDAWKAQTDADANAKWDSDDRVPF